MAAAPPPSQMQPSEQFDADGPESQAAEHDVLEDCDVEEPPTKKMRSLQREDSLALTRAMEASRAKRVKRHASNASSHASYADDEESRAHAPVGAGGETTASQATTITTFEDFTYHPEASEDDPPLSQSSAAEGTQDQQNLPPLWQSAGCILGPSGIGSLVDQIGAAGCILPDEPPGVAVDLGFHFLVRIALRCINLTPRPMLERLVLKYASHGAVQESISTTYSGTDAIVDAKMAVIVAVRMKVGLQKHATDFCGFSLRQVLAAEKDEWKRDKAIINRPRHGSITLGAVAKALVCLFVCCV